MGFSTQPLTIFTKRSILDVWFSNDFGGIEVNFQSAITCSKLTIETLEQGVKYV